MRRSILRVAFITASFLFVCVAESGFGQDGDFRGLIPLPGVTGRNVFRNGRQEPELYLYFRFVKPLDYRARANSDLNDLMWVLNSESYVKNLELTERQLDQFAEMHQEVQRKCDEFETFGYEELNDRDFMKGVQRKGSEINRFIEKRVEQILLPHQWRLLEKFDRRIKNKQKPFIEVLTSKPIVQELQLSEATVGRLNQKHKKLVAKQSELLENVRAKHRRELASVLTKDQQQMLVEFLGQKFVEGKPTMPRLSPDDKLEPNVGLCAFVIVERGYNVLTIKPNLRLDADGQLNRPRGILGVRRIIQRLSLGEKQIKSLKAIPKQLGKEFDGQLSGLAFEDIEKTQRLRIQFKKRSAEEMDKVLTASQRRELVNIWHEMVVSEKQFYGYLRSNFVRDALRLSNDDLEILGDTEMKLRPSRLESINKINCEYRGKLISILSREQQVKLFEMFGESYFSFE